MERAQKETKTKTQQKQNIGKCCTFDWVWESWAAAYFNQHIPILLTLYTKTILSLGFFKGRQLGGK